MFLEVAYCLNFLLGKNAIFGGGCNYECTACVHAHVYVNVYVNVYVYVHVYVYELEVASGVVDWAIPKKYIHKNSNKSLTNFFQQG